jgi:hypothetical protein
MKILAITAWKVLRPDGVSQPGHATMPEFLGTEAHTVAETSRSGA